MNRKERRKDLSPFRIQTPFQHIKSVNNKPEVNYIEQDDWRVTAVITLKWYASTKVKDADWDVIEPSIIDLTRFEAWNLPLKAQHGRWIHTNIWIITVLKKDDYGLYMEAEAKLDVTKDNNGRPINQDDYVIYDRLMNKTVTWFSIGFHNLVWEYNETNDVWSMTSITLHEVSVCDISSNPMTVIKMYEMAKGKFLSLHNEMPNKDVIIVSNKEAEENEEVVEENTEETVEEIVEWEEETLDEQTTEEEQENEEDEETEKEESEVSEEEEEWIIEESEKEITQTVEKEIVTNQEDGWDADTTEETSENEEKSLSDEGMKEHLLKAVDVIKRLEKENTQLTSENESLRKEIKELESIKVKVGLVKTETPKSEWSWEVKKAFDSAGIKY